MDHGRGPEVELFGIFGIDERVAGIEAYVDGTFVELVGSIESQRVVFLVDGDGLDRLTVVCRHRECGEGLSTDGFGNVVRGFGAGASEQDEQ